MPSHLQISPLELVAYLPLVAIILFLADQHRRRKQKTNPEYKYFTRGLIAKIVGGQVFALLYLFLYGGGDTINYFGSAVAMSRVFTQDFGNFMTILMSEPSAEAYSLFTADTGYVHSFIYWDARTLRVVKLISPLVIITGRSFLLSTLLMSVISYFGIWKLYRLFVGYFPALKFRLAIAILFLPSVIFWGSGLMKDTFTLSGACLMIYLFHRIFIRGRLGFGGIVGLMLASLLVILIKPYIFMILLPACLLWGLQERIKRLGSAAASTVLFPLAIVLAVAGSIFVFIQFGSVLDKFSIDKALNTAVVTQSDLKAARYSANSFDVGEFDASIVGVLLKFPVSLVAGLYRPFLWESTNVTMVISGVENLLLLIFTLYLLIKSLIADFFVLAVKHPIILFSLLFSISFAFVVGLTTSNFGALVRFKIPLLPLFVSSLFVIDYLLKQKYAPPPRTPNQRNL